MNIVYLDTVSINRIYELLNKKISLRKLKKYTYAISSCQIDELCLIESSGLRSQLVDFLFNISDKKKLKDHIELMASETLYLLGVNKDLDYFDPKFREYNDLLKLIIKQRVPDIVYQNFHNQMKHAKGIYKFEEKQTRTIFKPFFDLCSSIETKKEFRVLYREMENEGLVSKFLFETLNFEKDYLRFNFNNVKERILQLDLTKLNCTYVGLQAKIAYSYLSCFERGKLSQLKDSDQVDVRHLFYLNYADIFVTDDEKMHKVTENMIVGIKVNVESTESFINNYF